MTMCSERSSRIVAERPAPQQGPFSPLSRTPDGTIGAGCGYIRRRPPKHSDTGSVDVRRSACERHRNVMVRSANLMVARTTRVRQWLTACAAVIMAGAVATGASAQSSTRAPVQTVPPAANTGKIGARSMTDFKKPSDDDLKKTLSPLQYQVTQHEGTERPFQNEYWNNHEAGIYVDVVSGEPLFSSLDKYESGTGWPSFTQPLEPANVTTKTDRSLFMERTEVRSTHADSHLGHLFDDGPQPTGQRYCMNSASMRFIPVAKLAEEGYGQYLPLFEKAKR